MIPLIPLDPQAKLACRIGFAGDFFVHHHDHASPHFNDAVFSQPVDHFFVNLEGAVGLGDLKPRSKAGPPMKMTPPTLEKLAGSARHVVASLANNHCLDFGAAGILSTLENLPKYGIDGIGAGRNEDEAFQPWRRKISGEKELVAIAFCEAEDDASAELDRPGLAGYDVVRVANMVRQERERGNLPIVIFHGGREGLHFPSPHVQKLFRGLVDAGAACVIGHHPHLPQPWELWKGVPVFYNLGHSLFRFLERGVFDTYGIAVEMAISEDAKISGVNVILTGRPWSRMDHLERLDLRHPLYGFLREGCELVRDPSVVAAAWDYCASPSATLSKLKFLKRLGLFGSKIASPLEELRSSLGTASHNKFYERALSLILEPRPVHVPPRLAAFLRRRVCVPIDMEARDP